MDREDVDVKNKTEVRRLIAKLSYTVSEEIDIIDTPNISSSFVEKEKHKSRKISQSR